MGVPNDCDSLQFYLIRQAKRKAMDSQPLSSSGLYPDICISPFYGRQHDKDVMSTGSVTDSTPLAGFLGCAKLIESASNKTRLKGNVMTWSTPILVEICIGLEINGYLPAEF